jgi:UDP-3-O-[3-hydroxymyristoyl] N-acetylglucosamine deacetylase
LKLWKTQRTINKEAEFSGIGLHTGAMVHMKLVPAKANSGITFLRTDTADHAKIEVKLENIHQKPLCTTIVNGDLFVQTVEHLLSAIKAFGIDNLEIEINSIEPPGADGSAKEFCNLIQNSGIRELEGPRESYVITSPIYHNKGDSSIVILPNPQEGFRVSYTLDYNSELIPVQHYNFDFSTNSYIYEVSAARTFCFEHEARALKEAGFGKGASTRNTCVITDEGLLLDNEKRYQDEFVRHKILDLIGDLSIIGCDLQGHVVAIKSGHAENFELAKLIDQIRKNELREVLA